MDCNSHVLAQTVLSPYWSTPLILQDTFKSKWVQLVEQKIASLGLSRLTLLTMGMEQAKKIIKQCTEDIETQNDLSSAPAVSLS